MSLGKEASSPNQDRLQRMVESWSIKEPVGPIDEVFLRRFFSSDLFQEKVNQVVEEIKDGKILGEAGFEAWRTEEGFELYELIPIGRNAAKTSLTPHLTREKLEAGYINFFCLHFEPQHQEIVLPSAGFTPGRPPDMVLAWDFSGDLVGMNFSQELHRVVTGYDIAPIMVVGGVDFETGRTRLLFCQDTSQKPRDIIRFRFWEEVLRNIEDQERGVDFLCRIGYKVALLEWQGFFSNEDLEKLSQFAFVPTKVSPEERFAIDPLSQVESFLAATLTAPKTEEQLATERERLRVEEKRSILRKAGLHEPLVGLGMVLEDVENNIRYMEEFREINEEEAARLREILKTVSPPMPTLTKETIKGLIEDIVKDIFWEVEGANFDFFSPNERARIKRIILEYLDKRPHESAE